MLMLKMEQYSSRFSAAFDSMKDAVVTSRNKKAKSTIGELFEQHQFVAFYFYRDRSTLCQAFNDHLCRFVASEQEISERLQNSESNSAESTCDKKPVFVVVCIFSTEDKTSFQKLAAKLPWFVLERTESRAREKLMRIFRVRRAPCFSLIECVNKSVCAADCCKDVQEDPTGTEFPWSAQNVINSMRPKNITDVMNGELLCEDGTKKHFDTLPKGMRGVLFAAQWCPPCRTFVSKLKETYKKIKLTHSSFEIVYCSHDRTEQGFKKFSSQMPWLAIPFYDPRSSLLAKMFRVQEIPALLIFNEDWRLINRHGKFEVQADPLGKEFPWYPRSVIELTEKTSFYLREDLSLVLFTEGTSIDLTFAQTFFLPIAEEHFNDQYEPEIVFFYAGDDPVCDRILEVFGLSDLPLPLLCIVDPFSESLYVCDHPNVSGEIIRIFINKFRQDELVAKPFPKPNTSNV
ncbi:putative nucleoredoxin [Trichinella spiralis]|uniref:putative nucleoredoxin n=1 Tax=Trichinella spiralis TaxID=6334 RepID=UPI0001EFCE73|nr:putative nucleoredoxin [Trichinella spiralis]